MTTQSITSISDGQKKQYKRFIEDATDKALAEAKLDKDEMQRVIERGDEFSEIIHNAAIASIINLSVSDRFKDEEVESKYCYFSGYNPKCITEQTNRLREVFPGIGYANEKLTEGMPPANAEGWFAIPRWEKIAATYNEAVQKVLDMIKQTRNGKFYNCRKGQLGCERLRETFRATKFWKTICNKQKNNLILVVPAQFGLRYRGCSVRRAREVMQINEFGLGAFAVGIMLLTHPERLNNYDDLYVDCAGDEFDNPGIDARFDHAPLFHFYDDEVRFGAGWIGNTHIRYGAASAFLP